MLMTPSLTSSFHTPFAGIGQEGIRHDLNRLYYNDFSRQGMVDPQAFGAPFYAGYNQMAPWAYAPNAFYPATPFYGYGYQGYEPRYGYGYQGYEPRYSYARPYDYTRSFEFGRPYDYTRSFEFGRPYDYTRSFEFGRPWDFARSFEFGRPWDYSRSYEFGRPYDYTRSFEFGRPYDYTRSFEFGRPQEFAYGRQFEGQLPYGRQFEGMLPYGRQFEGMLPYGRQFEGQLPYFRSAESMQRPVEGLPAVGGDTFMVPYVNSAETPDAFLLVIELPGVDLKDVNLQIHGSALVLNAFRRPTWSNGTVTVNYHFAEGRFGTLRRVLPLPAGVLPGQIQANFLNGLLTIVLPKTGNGASAIPQASIVINSNVPTTM